MAMENLSVGLEGMNFESFILNELKNLNTRLKEPISSDNSLDMTDQEISQMIKLINESSFLSEYY